MRLSRLFAFNPDFGPREETEHLKLLFYWPPGATANARAPPRATTTANGPTGEPTSTIQ